MTLSVEWYLEQVEGLVDDCNDSGIRARIKWYINWVISQGGPSHVTGDQKRQIYAAYLFNRDGRNKFAQSMIQPIQVRYKYYREILDTRSQPFDWTWGKVLDGIRGAIVEFENFLSVYPEDERFTAPVCEVRLGLIQMVSLYLEARQACSGLNLDEVIPGTAITEADRLPIDTSSPSV